MKKSKEDVYQMCEAIMDIAEKGEEEIEEEASEGQLLVV